MTDDEHVDATRGRGQAAGQPQLLDAGVRVAERDEVRAEDVAGAALLDRGTRRDRALHRRLADDPARRPAALAHERPGQPPEDLGPLGARRLGRHERHGQLVRRERRLALPQAPLEVADRGVQDAVHDRVGAGSTIASASRVSSSDRSSSPARSALSAVRRRSAMRPGGSAASVGSLGSMSSARSRCRYASA